MAYEKKLIEGNFPCGIVGAETQRERGASSALPPLYFLHVWWARRPLTPSRAAILGSILPANVNPDDFVMELGIRKYQANICGVWIDIPERMIVENDCFLLWDKELEKVLKDENKLRKELREICNALIDKAPHLVDNDSFKKLLKRSVPVNEYPFLGDNYIETRIVPSDPVWFNDIKSLCSEYGIRVPNLYGYDRAYKNAPSKLFKDLTVLDVTAGGGSIPFEALRLGCNVIANDLNPVASAIELATLKYPCKFGQALVDDLSKYGDVLLETVNKKLKEPSSVRVGEQ